MEDRPGVEPNPEESSTAARVEEWLRNLRAQRAAAGESQGARPARAGQSSPADDPADAFLRAARRLAGSPRAQQALARRLMEAQADPDDPAVRALARVLQNLGTNLTDVLASLGAGGGAAVLDRPEAAEDEERKIDDTGGGGGDDDFDDDDGGGGGGDGGDDEEPWPSAFVGYRVGLVDALDVGNCRDGCCTAIFVDHPGLRAAVWFPTEAAPEMADKLTEVLSAERGDAAELGVPPFGSGDAPPRGAVQATIQFFTEDVHLDTLEPDAESDRKQGGVARFIAYDQGLGHGGPPLVDLLITPQQARALRRALRKAAKNAPPAEQP
ncbi:MAG TPA: hypothetical protein VFX49_04055 [Chloroflexota bacterium]|nr:hypothetical protein [Chloroflexota bacterium]